MANTYISSTDLQEIELTKEFIGQTRADNEGNYEIEWKLADGTIVRTKHNIYNW